MNYEVLGFKLFSMPLYICKQNHRFLIQMVVTLNPSYLTSFWFLLQSIYIILLLIPDPAICVNDILNEQLFYLYHSSCFDVTYIQGSS